MTFIRDYLDGKGRWVVLKDLRGLWSAALRCRTDDRGKVMSKPLVLSAVALLPHDLGDRLLQTVYAPTRLRANIARRLARRWRSVALLDRAPIGRG
jgi:hypothetical protein